MQSLDKVTIKGFKSIHSLVDFELRKDLNVIIGANGAGKSNFISFFKMLNALTQKAGNSLNRYISKNGNINNILYGGPKVTEKMFFEMTFGKHGFRFHLTPTPNETCRIENEARYYQGGKEDGWWKLGDNEKGESSMVREAKLRVKFSLPVFNTIESWIVYHFHDTGNTAKMRSSTDIDDNRELHHDAGNIAAFLFRLQQETPDIYQHMLDVIKMAIPFFHDFHLYPRQNGNDVQIKLEWYQKDSDHLMQPYHFSDGSIRFICLVVALLQPNPPATMIIDEPEIGLHPSSIALLAELIQIASGRTQMIIATQSPDLISYFHIDNIIVATRKDGQSCFERLKYDDYALWLEEYSIGDLWCQNIIRGGISYE